MLTWRFILLCFLPCIFLFSTEIQAQYMLNCTPGFTSYYNWFACEPVPPGQYNSVGASWPQAIIPTRNVLVWGTYEFKGRFNHYPPFYSGVHPQYDQIDGPACIYYYEWRWIALSDCVKGGSSTRSKDNWAYVDKLLYRDLLFHLLVDFINPVMEVGRPCNVGTFNNLWGQTACRACFNGTYAAVTGSTRCETCSSICAPGLYVSRACGGVSAGVCLACSNGTFNPTPGRSICTACGVGTYATGSGSIACSSCTLCAPGQIISRACGGSDAGSCMPCNNGTFTSIPGLSQCIPCAIGTYATGVGFSSCIACASCPPGTRSFSCGGASPGICANCTGGTYTSMSGSIDCIPCSVGTYATGMRFTSCVACVSCPPGHSSGCGGSSPGGVCVICSIGTYPGATSCVGCSPGTYADQQGSSACTNCPYCGPGNYIWHSCSSVYKGLCLPCWPGTSQYRGGQFTCLPCYTGTYAPHAGAAECIPCPSPQCLPGRRIVYTCSGSSIGTCEDCVPGTYLNGNGWECIHCPINTYANYSAATACLSCVVCPAGYSSGCGGANGGRCDPCGFGFYQSLSGQGTCISCLIGHYCHTLITITPIPCNITTYNGLTGQSACVSCPEGHRCSTMGLASPTACGLGFYQPSAGASICLVCPTGQFCPSATTVLPTPCLEGHRCSDMGLASPTGCGLGFYQPSAGAFICLVCPAGQFCPSVTTVLPTPCPNSTFNVNPGQHLSSSCRQCLVGNQCNSTGLSAPIPCGLGFFQSAIGAVNCLPCPVGTYCPFINTSTPIACMAGTYRDNTGGVQVSDCMLCPAGAYCIVQSVNPTLCPTGTYNLLRGGRSSANCTVCAICPAGNFIMLLCGGNTAGICTACAPGYYSTTAGVTFCMRCPPKTYSTSIACNPCTQCSEGNVFSTCLLSNQGTCGTCSVGSYASSSTTCTVCPVCIPLSTQAQSTQGCRAGQYMRVPVYTACVACAAGTFSTGIGLLDSIEVRVEGSASYSYSSIRNGCLLQPHLDTEGAWCPAIADGKQWIRIDLGQAQSVNGILTQGHALTSEWVTAFDLSYSLDSIIWNSAWTYVDVNSDSFTKVVTMIDGGPVFARYIQLLPTAFNTWPSLRWSVLLQKVPCATCQPGFFSVRNNVSICSACAAPPSNAFYYAGECDSWKCNIGFYRNGAICVRCQNSFGCLSGQFRPQCTDGFTDTQNCTGICTNKPQITQSLYLGPSSDNTENSCPWGCNLGFFKNIAIQSCSPCPPPCDIGFYMSTTCIALSVLAMETPRCIACIIPSNSFAIGAGNMAGNASSCPITCNVGFWGTGSWCSAWTAMCSNGFAWSPGTATSDARCTACPNAQDPNYVFVQNTCSFTCGIRYELVQNGTLCQGCAAGKFKNNSLPIPCQLCPSNQYQNNPTQSECLNVPPNSVANEMRTWFTCNDGFFLQGASIFSISDTCQACIGNPVLNSQQSIWRGCSLISLTCNQGFYRNWSILGCNACGPVPVNSIQAPYNASAFCATCNTTISDRDKLISCPFTCNAGFYHLSGSMVYGCTRCTTISCSLGFFPQLCTPPSLTDTCLVCTYQLSPFQMWVHQCQWQCVAGYTLAANQASCVLCPSGLFKTAVGNQSCIGCGAGLYALSALSCLGCLPGTFNNVSNGAVSACTTCPVNTISAHNASICTLCPTSSSWPNVYALASRTACVQCGWAMPIAIVWNHSCTHAVPPCRGGYYQPYGATICILCPQGTYCIEGQAPQYCTNSLSSTIPAISLANCSGPPQSISACTTNQISQCIPNIGFYGLPPQSCPYDTYCPRGSLIPIACPSNRSFALMNSGSISNCTPQMMFPCRPGYYVSPMNGSFCMICVPGCYCSGNVAEIVACDATTNYSSPMGATSVLQCVSPLINGSSSTITCPLNTRGQVLTQSFLQCRANAGFYYLPGASTSAIPCPSQFYCPVNSVIPIPCPLPPETCPLLGQYPTPNSLCPFSGAAQPSAACQSCSGLPSNAYWISNTDASCPFCCQTNYYSYSTSACNLQPDSSSCIGGEYMPIPLPCAKSVLSCLKCSESALPIGMTFVNTSMRPSYNIQGYGIASGCSRIACAAGFRLSSNICLPCPAGTFKSWVGNDTVCYACPDGMIAINSTSCHRCPMYSIAWQGLECRCMIGFFMNATLGICVACAPGFVTINGTQTACMQCIPGTRWITPLS